jgi:hypothetical protein
VAQGSATAFLRAGVVSPQRGSTIATGRATDKSNPERNHPMVGTSNGVSPMNSGSSPRCPRRIVLLCDGEHSAVQRVLLEYHGAEVSGKRLHADMQRLAEENSGSFVAAEWLGALGWTRFLWCRPTKSN